MNGKETLPCRVLLVDDQEMVFETLKLMLQDVEGVECYFCKESEKALERAIEIKPTVILQDLMMPGIDGLTMVRLFRGSTPTKRVPLIVLSAREESKVKAEAFALGANDYLVKLPGKEEMVARIRYHSRAYLQEIALHDTVDQLHESQKELLSELHEAADYVLSRLPPPIDGLITTEWEFLPSTELGGDGFGYFWQGSDHFVIYLIDVCGHGVGAALLSVQVLTAISERTIKGIDYLSPSSLLAGLNRSFPMEKHSQMFFTIWYGVLNVKTGELRYAIGGHPPPVLFQYKEGAFSLKKLPGGGLLVGGIRDASWEEEHITLAPKDQLLIFSDGAFERINKEGKRQGYTEFFERMEGESPEAITERLSKLALSESLDGKLADDCSILLMKYKA